MCKILLLFFFTISTSSYYWVPVHKMPYEIENLVSSLQFKHFNNKQIATMTSYIQKIDFIIKRLNQKDLYFISKVIVFRYLLENPPQESIQQNLYIKKVSFINILSKTSKSKLLPFPRWFITSLQSDLKKMYTLSDYKKYIQWKKGKTFATPATLKINTYLKLILPWYKLFNKKSIPEINFIIQPIIQNLLSHLIQNLELFWELEHNKNIFWPSKPKISWFKKEFINKNPSHSEILNTIDSVIKKHKEKGLPVPVTKEWIPKNEDFSTYLTPFDPNQKLNPNYIPPKRLPKPTHDWTLPQNIKK